MNKPVIAVASESDRSAIYHMRHTVYADELCQYQSNAERWLTDSLDDFNSYIVAKVGGEIAGFVSITPPGKHYSIDKYFARPEMPFAFDDKLFEIRILTVAKAYRKTPLASVLMYAAFRWIESHGGTRIVAIGRQDLMGLYSRVGMSALGRSTRAGAVTYELMTCTLEEVRQAAKGYERLLGRLEKQIDWKVGVRFQKATPCYHGGSFFNAIGDEFQTLGKSREVINADVLDAWYPPSPKVLEGLKEYGPWLLRTSPPTGCEGVIRSLARVRGVQPENILMGAGSSSLIYLAFRTWLTPSSKVLILDPTYGEYAHVLENVVGCRIDRLFLSRHDDYRVPLEELRKAVKRDYDLIVLVNPNSPTGQHIQRSDLQRVLSEVPQRTRIWVDETYVDYIGTDQSLETFAIQRENLVICKSMSKVYALSGARVAYLCASPALLEDLKLYTPPWVIALPSQVAAIQALQDPDYYARRYRETHELREQFVRGLKRIGTLEPVPSRINSVLCHIAPNGMDADTLAGRAQLQGLFIRNVKNMSSRFGDRVVRIAIKDAKTNDRMLQILCKVTAEMAAHLV